MALKNEQYNLIMSEYDSRRFNRTAEINERMEAVYLAIPAYREADNEIRHYALKEVARRLDGDTPTPAEASPIHTITEKKRKLLLENNFPADFLDVPYTCPDCKDTGFVNGKHCHCFNQLANELLYNNHTVYSRNSTLQDFSLDYYSKDFIDEKSKKSAYDLATKALSHAEEFIKSFRTDFNNILLYGKPGTGKTHLSNCIGNELRIKGTSVIYLSSSEIFSIMKKEAYSRSIYPDNEYLRLFSSDLLIIDDLGCEFSNSMTNSLLFELLNERILRKKSTLISTNLDLAGIAEVYSERLFSRFMEFYTLLPLIGDDIRIIRKTKGDKHAKK